MHGYVTIQNRYSTIILFKVLEKRKLYSLKYTINNRCYMLNHMVRKFAQYQIWIEYEIFYH